MESVHLLTHNTELARLAAVESYRILDTPPEADFDQLVALASTLFSTPIASVTVMAEDRLWFKSAKGLDVCEAPRQDVFCQLTVAQKSQLVIEDTQQDALFRDNPLVVHAPFIRAYAGIPLINEEGYAIGTFCVMDHVPRRFSETELTLLTILANQAMKLMELRREIVQRTELSKQLQIFYEQQAKSQELWKQAMDAVGDGVWDYDLITGHYFFGPNWRKMLGYQSEPLLPQLETLRALIHEEDQPRFTSYLQGYLQGQFPEYKIEYRIRCKNGEYKWVLSRGMVVERTAEDTPKRMIGTHTDISQSKLLEQSIWQQAHTDNLTGLPNRRLFLDRLQQAIYSSQREQKKFALFFMDLDGFKAVNDQHGHLAGDQLLIEIASRIQKMSRQADTFARFAGDEFAILAINISNSEDMVLHANKILQVVKEPIPLNGYAASVSISIGIAIFPDHGCTVDTLIRHADQAMYEAKESGKNTCVVYHPHHP